MHTTEEKSRQGRAVRSKQQPEDRPKVTSEICCFSINLISVTLPSSPPLPSKNIGISTCINCVQSILMLPVQALGLHWHPYSYPLILQFGANVGPAKPPGVHSEGQTEKTAYCMHTLTRTMTLKYFWN